MEPRDFCYWLQGYLEVSGTKEITPEQLQMIKDHLQTVFTKVTPSYVVAPAPLSSSGDSTYPWSGSLPFTGSIC